MFAILDELPSAPRQIGAHTPDEADNDAHTGSRKRSKAKVKDEEPEFSPAHEDDDIWYSGDAAERLRLRDFWAQLSEEDRKALVKLERDAVLKKVKEQQKQTCSCHVCGRRRLEYCAIDNRERKSKHRHFII